MKKRDLLLLTASCSLVAALSTGAFKKTNPTIANSAQLDTAYNDLTDIQKRSPKYALAGIDVAEGLQASLFAHEPMLTNPTNIDIDEKGRIWVCEAYNYRPAITGNAAHREGDRILILEDTDGDAKADKSTVFYQDPELNAPLGIWVMGSRVIVSQSPYVWLLTDTDGDNVADKKEIIFQGIGGEQHDHGMHAFTFGPDGKFYFNFGNSGGQLLDSKGKPVVDKNGETIDFKKYREGMVFRCDPDFTNLEVLGFNFRNNYEVAVDSYGAMWQSDNDDDGNKGVRINYVMDFGNYGFKDELTGASWRVNRTNQEDSIPLRHWHLNDPGVVPNLLQTGGGSPTGMIVYEGRALPSVFWDQMIHCDAGPNVVRAYPVQKAGAGYTAKMVNILEGKRDQWFRPSDVCTAPDGSIFVSDWYDPGVGGHQAGDLNRGRIYRVSAPNTPYRTPKFDFASVDGAIRALQNPNLSVRYHAWNALVKMENTATPVLKKLATNTQENARLRARALWVLSKTKNFQLKDIEAAFTDENPDIRITALRITRQLKSPDLMSRLRVLANDPNPQIRRECAVALHHSKEPEAAEIWATLATQHDGNDRWYLEALGIGAANQWDNFFAAWLKKAGPDATASAAGKDIIWRSRGKSTLPLLASLAGDASVPLKDRLRYFRAFDFNPADSKEKSRALERIMKSKSNDQATFNQLVFRHFDADYVKSSPTALAALKKLLDQTYGTDTYIEMVDKYQLSSENNRLLRLAIDNVQNPMARTAATLLIKQGGAPLVLAAAKGTDQKKGAAALTAIRNVGNEQSITVLRTVAMDDTRPLAIRREAIRAMGGSNTGEDLVLQLLKENKLSGEVKAAAIQGLSTAWRKSVRTEAASYLDAGATSAKKHPEMKQLLALTGDANIGKAVFTMYCASCHQVNNEGADFGPKLSEIGSKLPKEAQYLAILYPSAGISFGYEGYEVKFKDGSAVTGIISSQTESDLIMKLPGGSSREYKMNQVKSIKQLSESIMPAGLQDAMSTDELTGLIEYMSSLKAK